MIPLSREAFADAVQQLYDLNDQASVDTILSSYHDVCDQLAASQSRCTQLEEALGRVRYELAGLFPIPSIPSREDAVSVCSNKNPADAECLLYAMEHLNDYKALTSTERTPA